MKAEDIYGPVCGCGECLQAGVAQEQTRRDPYSGRMIHGFELRRGLEAFKSFQLKARAAVGPRSVRGGDRFKKLAGR